MLVSHWPNILRFPIFNGNSIDVLILGCSQCRIFRILLVAGGIFQCWRKKQSRTNRKKIQPISEFKEISTLKKTQTFSGMCALVANFIAHLAQHDITYLIS